MNDADIQKIAHLARIAISAEDTKKVADKLTRVLTMVEQIQQADTRDIEPMAHPLEDMVQRLRADEVTETNARETFQALAPSTAAGLYLVPKVIDGGEA